MRKHEAFILTPISKILKEAAIASSSMEMGIASYPLCDYIMQSLFLKMTGMQEQKMKCISWELATDDYELRYLRYKRDPLGECSSYSDKKKVLFDLIHQLECQSEGSSNLTDAEKDAVIDETKNELEEFYNQPQRKGWSQKPYHDFKVLFSSCNKNCLLFINGNGKVADLFGHCDNCGQKNRASSMSICRLGTLIEAYESLFKHRNRCAHNTSSFQQDLPALDTMDVPAYLFENYYLRFALLILIDKIFIRLFQKYLDKCGSAFIP